MGIQLASQVAVQVVLSMLAGAVVIGAMSVARGAPFLPSEERRLFVFPNRLQPMVPFQLMFMGVPLLIVSLLADSPASLVSAALLGALLVIIPWPSRNKSWQRGSWQGVSSSHRRSSLVGPNIQGAHTQAPHGRFEKFSEGARSVLSHAQEEAQWFNHNYIGTEYILLGLVREPEGVAAKVLTNLGVELSKVRSAVEFIIGSGERPGPGDIGLTPRAKKVIELAVDEARRLSHHTSSRSMTATYPSWPRRSLRLSRGREQRGKTHLNIPLTSDPLPRPGVGHGANRDRRKIQPPKEGQTNNNPRR